MIELIFLPLLACFANALPFGMALCIAILIINFVNIITLYELGSTTSIHLPWLATPKLDIKLQLTGTLDAFMLLLVAGIGLLVVIYSINYLKEIRLRQRFLMLLSSFIMAMQLFVVATDIISLFFAWELLGFMSFALIGFYSSKAKAATASFKAFIVNRLSDVFLLVALILYLITYGHNIIQPVDINMLISSLFILGILAKSAQIPLYFWLPDSMVGPSPVSAMIHSATMVCAGLYLLIKFNFLIHVDLLPILQTLSYVGTIVFGLVAIYQDDIKRVIAYSTLSQLSFMMLAIAYQMPMLAFLHLLNHGIFKALWFLVAGSMINLYKSNSIKVIGTYKQPVLLHIGALTATLSLMAMPMLGGYGSKELIVNGINALPSSWHLINVVSVITIIYAVKLYLSVCFGKTKHTVQVPFSQNFVIVILSVLCFGMYWVNLPILKHLGQIKELGIELSVLIKALLGVAMAIILLKLNSIKLLQKEIYINEFIGVLKTSFTYVFTLGANFENLVTNFVAKLVTYTQAISKGANARILYKSFLPMYVIASGIIMLILFGVYL